MSSAVPDLYRALLAFDAAAFARRHGGRKESRSARSREYLFSCPRCGGHNLRWNSGKSAWLCWNCRQSGDSLDLVQLLERCSRAQAVEFVLSGYVGGDASLELRPVSGLAPWAVATAAPARARRLPAVELPRGCVPAAAYPMVRNYLLGRGIDDALARYWDLRAGTAGPWEARALFPVHMDGVLAYYQARACWDPPAGLPPNERRAWVERTRFRKTLNPFPPCYAPGVPGDRPGRCRDCRSPLAEHSERPRAGLEPATAGEVLYNFDRARTSAHVVVVEGPVDAIKVGPHAVALLGKGTDEKVRRLRLMSASRYTVYLDRGAEEWRRTLELASALSGYAQVYLAEPPLGRDAGDLSPQENAEVLARALPLRDAGLRSSLRP